MSLKAAPSQACQSKNNVSPAVGKVAYRGFFAIKAQEFTTVENETHRLQQPALQLGLPRLIIKGFIARGQFRDAAATARVEESRQSCSRQPTIPATLSDFLPETRANRRGRTDYKGLLQTWLFCAYLKLPNSLHTRRRRHSGNLEGARGVTCPSSFLWSFLVSP
ncbi:unnamed protein product [Acanthosepion pharaonis]|uniref:Uncharacterized protein n=1 Tax=Acanthosepion pharaonis TaxID=158019 RepID=A0A812E9M5_ACAPH|nr:unnamed protein product [Sepia pharaonis]